MRSDKVSIEQAHQMMLKYFASGYSLDHVVQAFKQSRTKKSILESLQQSLKDILIELQGQIYAAKYIKTLRIYDNINITRIKDYIINLKDILNLQTGSDLLVYYKYKHQFIILTRFQVIQVPVQPVTSKKKYTIYEAFIDYFQIKGVFEQKIYYKIPQRYREKYQIQTSQQKNYSPQQMTQILKIYEQNQGRVSEICQTLRLRGYPKQKYQKHRIRELLIQNITIGIGRVYKLSNNLDRFSGCAWDKFQNIHINMIKNFTFQQKLRMLKAGIHNTIEDIDVYEMCQKIGIRYRPVGYPKWVKDNSHINLYRNQKMSVLSKIKDQMKGIVKNEMKKSKKVLMEEQ